MNKLRAFRILLPAVGLIVAMCGTLQSQTIQLGISTSGTNLVISAKPSATMTGSLTGSAMTIRWLDSYGVTLGDITSSFGYVKGDVERVSGVYRYQMFVQMNPTPVVWNEGVEYVLFTVPVNQTGAGMGVFELPPTGFTGTGEGDPYVEWNAMDYTNPTDTYFNNSTTVTLPVELTAFTVTPDKQGATLTWKTATEVNNAGFEVERATVSSAPDAVKKWAKLGFVEGSGTSNAPKEYTYKNKNVQTGKYAYRLKQIDRDGRFVYSQEIEAMVAAPEVFALSQNYPNPFNPTSTVNFALAKKSMVTIKLYDITGREVQTVMQSEMEPGYYTAAIDGRRMASGVYFYRMTAAEGGHHVFTETKRLMLLK